MTNNNTPDVIIRGKAIKFHNFDTELGRIFGFTENELDWNHKGKLSPMQHDRYIEKRDRFVGLLVIGAVILLFALFGLIVASFPNIGRIPAGAQVIFGVIPIWMLISAFVIWHNRTAEIEGQLVAITTGKLNLSIKGSKAGAYNLMMVDHRDWQITDFQFHRLSKLQNQEDGITHVAVYYLANSDQLLSIVQVDMLADHSSDESDTDNETTVGIFAWFHQLKAQVLRLLRL